MKYLFTFYLLLCCIPGHTQDAESQIRQIMQNQQDCWNKGDLNCFMIGYWESDSLMFIGKEKIYYGFKNTLNRYKKAYPDRASMGQLTFEFQSMRPLGDDAFYVIGSYHLARTIGDARGHFTLLWRKIAGSWVMVADHSS